MNNEQVARLQQFFIEGAAQGYAGDREKTRGDFGSKVYRYERDYLIYLDMYFTNGEYTSGSTTIFEQGLAIWQMQYQGWCKDDNPNILSFLKLALKTNYVQGIWLGGRGPAIYRSDKWRFLEYTNEFTGTDPFFCFSGLEMIRDLKTLKADKVFWHRYQGMLLAPVEGDQPSLTDELLENPAYLLVGPGQDGYEEP